MLGDGYAAAERIALEPNGNPNYLPFGKVYLDRHGKFRPEFGQNLIFNILKNQQNKPDFHRFSSFNLLIKMVIYHQH